MLYESREAGTAAAEYALILALMVILVMLVMALVGPAIGNVFSHLTTITPP